ncbi:MAG: LytR/AlgR family response regulator transcription factor [Saprospiraceae bacterium]
MPTLNILIVEDEPIIARDLSFALTDMGYQVTGIAHSAAAALQYLAQEQIDLCLLDINIEGHLSGIDVAHIINQQYQIPFVYLTSYSDQNTLERVKITQPFGYLVKPVDEPTLKSTLEIALYNFQNQTAATKGNNEEFWLESEFFIRHRGELVKVNVSDILYAEASDNYTLLHTEDQKYVVSAVLKKVEEKLLPHAFCRIHRSYLINLRCIQKVAQYDVYLGGKPLPISRKYREDFLSKITTF